MVYYFAIIFSVIFIIFIINLVRRNKLDEKYSILWLIFSVILLILSIAPVIIIKLANKFNVYYPPALLFLLAIMVMGAYIVHITIVITKQNKSIVNLTQKIALLEKKVSSKNENN